MLVNPPLSRPYPYPLTPLPPTPYPSTPNQSHPTPHPHPTATTPTTPLLSYGYLCFQNYEAVAVELVFPQCAEIRLPDTDEIQNKANMSSVISGDSKQCQTGLHVITGSRAEGFAMEPGWGHEEPDKDVMIIYGGSHVVDIGENVTSENPYQLTLSTTDCYPAYCRIKVNGCLKAMPQSKRDCLQTFQHYLIEFMAGNLGICVIALLTFLLHAASPYDMWYLYQIHLIFFLLTYVPRLFYKWINVKFILQGAIQAIQHHYICYFYGRLGGSIMHILLHLIAFRHRFSYVVVLYAITHWLVIISKIYPMSLIYTLVPVILPVEIVTVELQLSPQMITWLDALINIISSLCFLIVLFISYVMYKDPEQHYFTFYLYKMMSLTTWSEGVINRWLVYITRDKTRWLSSAKSLQRRTVFDISKGGPSGPSQCYEGYDSVPALLCSSPFLILSTIKKWFELSWPLLPTMVNIPGILVGVGHSLSDNKDIEWRTSWSIHELLLAQTLPCWVKQGYWAFKYTVTSKLKRPKKVLDQILGKTNGRGQVSSYHMKTILYTYLQEPDAWVETCPYKLCIGLLKKLRSHLWHGNLPNFFVPECNLFQTTPQEELDRSLLCINQILADPVLAILQSPRYIHEVYGGSRWSWKSSDTQHSLIKLFHQLKTKTLFEEDALLLYKTLQRIDSHRRLKYNKQLHSGANFDIRERRGLETLHKKMFDCTKPT